MWRVVPRLGLAVPLAARSVGRRLFFSMASDVCTLSCAAFVMPCRSALREGGCLVTFACISTFATASIFFFVMGLALWSCPPRKASMRRLRGSSLARACSFCGGNLPQHETSGSLGTSQRYLYAFFGHVRTATAQDRFPSNSTHH